MNRGFSIHQLIYFILFHKIEFSNAARPGYYESPQDFSISTYNILSTYLDNQNLLQKVLQHGCHCSRFDAQLSNKEKRHLGGHESMDELDEICKSWFSSRMCIQKFDQGVCQNLDNSDFKYEFEITVNNRNQPNSIACQEVDSDHSVRK